MEFQGLKEAVKTFNANLSPRYMRLDALEKWVSGTQYDGKCDWWSDEVPLWERAPCIVYPIVHIAIQSNVDLCLGENRFPSISSKPAEDEATEDNGLGEADSATLDRFIQEYHKLCRFRSHAREAFAAGQGCGTAVGIHGARAGVPFADLFPAKWCTPQLDVLGSVLSLEVKYPYLDQYKQPDGKWAVRTRLFRRVIDAVSDTTFLPGEANENGTDPSWSPDPAQTFAHNLGFCPVVWYPFMRGCQPVNVIDGKSLHENFTDEIQAHDIALSQRHRGALLSEPQPVELGVQPGYNPTEPGRSAVAVSTPKGGIAGPGNMPNGSYGNPASASPARKRGPGYVWQYTDPETKVQYLSYPADALKAQTDNANDLKMKLQESLAVVLLGPDEIKAIHQLSGKALEAMKQKQIDRCDQFREDLADHFLLPSVDLQLRIAAKLGASLRVPGAAKIAGILKKFEIPDVATSVAAA